MKAYVSDSFTDTLFGGNQAGVVLFENGEEYLHDELMRKIAAEFKHSETAFVRRLDARTFRLRYFTPAAEVPLCGHATIAAFCALRDEGFLAPGAYAAQTNAGLLGIQVRKDVVWMDMAPAKMEPPLDEASCAPLYEAYGLSQQDRPEGLSPRIADTGLRDIILPVKDKEALLRARQDEKRVCALSQQYDAVGVHMFCLGGESILAFCSNFAPAVGIPEECATGTANGALTHYLYHHGLIAEEKENLIIQGEHMGRRSQILSRVLKDSKTTRVQIGGNAVILMECLLRI